MQGWSKGTLDNLCCLGATTGKLGGNLAVREHGLAESSEAICNQEGNVVFCHKVGEQNSARMTSEINLRNIKMHIHIVGYFSFIQIIYIYL